MARYARRPRHREHSMAQSLTAALVSRDCPICGPGTHGRLFADANIDPTRLDGFAFSSRKPPEFMHYRLVECAACDLVYASSIPSVDFLEEAYEEAEFASGVEAEYASRT